MRGRGAWALLVSLVSACSLLIDGEPRPLRCAQEGQQGPPACDPGMVCRAGTCQVPAPGPAAGAPATASRDDESNSTDPSAGRGQGGDAGWPESS